MSSLRKNPAKIFVKVRADHLLDGSTRPLMLRSEDGPTLRIDRVLDVRALLSNVEMQKVFEKGEMTMWECRNCGHLVMGTKAPAVCPVCAHPQSYFEVRGENY